jgi:phasin family protein
MAKDSRSAASEHPMGPAGFAMEDFTKAFAQLKLPAVPDVEAVLNAHRRNLEAFTAANRVALEGAQAVARRQAEIMQQALGELTDTMRALATADSPQAKAARQADLLKQAYERAVANAKELSDLIQRSNGEAVAVLNHRFVEALGELKSLMEKSERAG